MDEARSDEGKVNKSNGARATTEIVALHAILVLIRMSRGREGGGLR